MLPVNAIIALCTPGDVYPAPFAEAGYVLAGLETPAAAGDGKVVIDAVLFRTGRNLILAVEGKSGNNVEEDQARRYGELKADDVVVAAAISLREPGGRALQPMYVCLAESLDRVLQGLGEAGLACPVLAMSDDRIEHHGAGFLDPELEQAFAGPVVVPGPPPRHIPVDEDSPDEAFDALVLPTLVSQLSHKRQQVSVPALAETALAHLPVFGKAARSRLVAKVDGAARRAAERDPATFEYHGRTGTREYAVVRSVRNPEDAARQGRTQVYRAIARAAGKPWRRGAPGPDQMALFDELIDELEQVDEPEDTTTTDSDDKEEGGGGAE